MIAWMKRNWQEAAASGWREQARIRPDLLPFVIVGAQYVRIAIPLLKIRLRWRRLWTPDGLEKNTDWRAGNR